MSLPPGFQSWAARLVESLLPLDPDSITQIIKVAATEQGGPEGAGRYLKELLGESEEALDFIAEFTRRLASTSTGLAPPLGSGSRGGSGSNTPNSRSRPITPVSTPPPGKQQQQTGWSISESAPLSKRSLHGGGGGSRGGKGGKMGYKQELRKPAEVDENSGLKAYRKNDEEDSYYSGGKKAGGGSDSGATTPQKVGHAGTLQGGKEVGNGNPITTTRAPPQQKQPKLAGTLTSDLLAPKYSSKNTATSTTKTAGGNAHKIHISATNSHLRAPNTGLSDLEYALRALELTTNPTLNNTQKRIKCNCQATKHDLLLAAPNCLSCGKIICIKEGPGPCTFCGTPLLSSSETQDMISFLREERGREKMQADNRANRKAEVGRGSTKAYSQPHGAVPPQLGLGYGVPVGPSTVDDDAAALQRAREHRDKLLAFQASNAQRTKIIDEAADFDTSAISSGGYSGLNMWATPEERALQLKKQQKRMRELEWAGKEAWEKRKVVVSIDISGKGKGAVVRREMKELEMHEVMNSDDDDVVEDIRATEVGGEGSSEINKNRAGQYSRNPLLKGLIRPVFTPPEPKKPKSQHPAKDDNNRGKGKEKPKARQINDDYTFTGQVDDYDDAYDYNDDGDDELYDNYELPDIVKQRLRDAKMGRVGGSDGGGWKRVLQDEQEVKDNEKWILDGGRSGGVVLDGAGGADDLVDTNTSEGPECG